LTGGGERAEPALPTAGDHVAKFADGVVGYLLVPVGVRAEQAGGEVGRCGGGEPDDALALEGSRDKDGCGDAGACGLGVSRGFVDLDEGLAQHDREDVGYGVVEILDEGDARVVLRGHG
jgi:hypothetical protein